MATTPVNLPSINIPFVDSRGCLSPIWHEFLRSFVTGAVEGTIIPPGIAPQVVAGNGLIGGGPITSDMPLRVGQGSGLAVNADDVSVDITNQPFVVGTLDDELLVSDVSDNNQIRKTTLRDVAGLSSPGGLDSHVQYNAGGIFSGNSGFTYDGIQAIGLGGVVTYNGATISTATNATKFIFQVPAGSASTHYTFRQVTGTGSSAMPVLMSSNLASTDLIIDNCIDGTSTTSESRLKFNQQNTTKWTMGCIGSGSGSHFVMALTALNTGAIYTIDATTNNLIMSKSLQLSTEATITASTTQTQGQRPLTNDVNEISTCVNANDTVTLPAALAGRNCLVINNGAAVLQVFPASGDNLGAGVNTSTTVASGSRKWFVAFDTTNWEPVI